MRHFDVQEFAEWTPNVTIILDASPWALGAWLLEDKIIVEYFSSELTSEDTERFGVATCDPAGQQTWESLASLVALRCWAHRWQHKRVTLQIEGDSVAMLTMLLKMRPPSPEMGLIAREVALDEVV